MFTAAARNRYRNMMMLISFIAAIFAPLAPASAQQNVYLSEPSTEIVVTSVTVPFGSSGIVTQNLQDKLEHKRIVAAKKARIEARKARIAAREAAHREWQKAPVYTVREGDTLSEIAYHCGAKSYKPTAASPWNHIENAHWIVADQRLHIIGAKSCSRATNTSVPGTTASTITVDSGSSSTMVLPQLTPRTPAEAVAAAKAMVGYHPDTFGACQHMVGVYYGLGATGYDWAKMAWNNIPSAYKHPGDMTPPAGALVYFSNSNQYGHAALSIGNGYIVSTDYPSAGHIGIVRLSTLHEQWHNTYYGWTSPYFNVGLPANPNPQPVVQQTASATSTSTDWHDMTHREWVEAAGWHLSDYEFAQLDKLIVKESGWNPQADNPNSSAYGVPQALPGDKMESVGDDWETNPITQLRWMKGYVEETYGSPSAAWAHSVRYNWY